VGVECLGGKASRSSFRQDVASGAKVPSDHGRVRSLPSERVVERLEDPVGTAAGFLLRSGGQDRDVDGTGSRAVDLLAQTILVGRGDRELRAGFDVDRTRLQPGDCLVDDRAGLRRRHEDERRGRGHEQEQLLHGN